MEKNFDHLLPTQERTYGNLTSRYDSKIISSNTFEEIFELTLDMHSIV